MLSLTIGFISVNVNLFAFLSSLNLREPLNIILLYTDLLFSESSELCVSWIELLFLEKLFRFVSVFIDLPVSIEFPVILVRWNSSWILYAGSAIFSSNFIYWTWVTFYGLAYLYLWFKKVSNFWTFDKGLTRLGVLSIYFILFRYWVLEFKFV